MLFYNRNLIRKSSLGKLIALKSVFYTITCIFWIISQSFTPALAQDQKTILAFGDSLFTSQGLEPGESFPEQLETKLNDLGQSVNVIQAGFDGYTTEDAVEIIDGILDRNPDIDLVVFIFGGNDYFQNIPTNVTRQNMDRMLKIITDRNIPTLMGGLIIPFNGYLGYSNRLNDVYTDLAAKYQVTLDPFFLEGVAGVSELNQIDGIHPNKFGNTVIATRVSGIVNNMLTEMDQYNRVQSLLAEMDSTLEKVSAENVAAESPITTPVSTNTSGDKNILIFGDSLVAGLGLDPQLAFPAQLETKLKEMDPNITVHNAGVSGDTSSGGMARLEWVISAHQDLDLVVVLFGGNDALRGIHYDLTRRNMDKMVELLKNKNIPTLVAGMVAPPNMGEVYSNSFNSIYPEVAEKHNASLYPFFLDGVAGVLELNQQDRIHPNKEGVAYIVERISPVIYDLVSGD